MMDLVVIVLSEVSHIEKDKCLYCAESKTQNKLASRTRNRLIDTENTLMVASWEGDRG